MTRLTAAEYRAQQEGAKKRHKFGAKRTALDGIMFASKREAERWAALKIFELFGEIRELDRQVEIPLMGATGPLLTAKGNPMHYVADFTYINQAGELVIEDAKGYRTPEYKLKRAILAAQGIKIKEV